MLNTINKTRHLASLLLVATAISGCASKPYVVQPVQPQDESLDCTGISQELHQAQYYKVNARADDKFQWRYMLIVPTVLSAYNWEKAEEAAQDRIDHLTKIFEQKNCHLQGNTQQGWKEGDLGR